uniref:Uncharacterized protein n=1 Tax=Anopheles melas TaxID=34690 RepID=A0A182UC33_9DIPT
MKPHGIIQPDCRPHYSVKFSSGGAGTDREPGLGTQQRAPVANLGYDLIYLTKLVCVSDRAVWAAQTAHHRHHHPNLTAAGKTQTQEGHILGNKNNANGFISLSTIFIAPAGVLKFTLALRTARPERARSATAKGT